MAIINLTPDSFFDGGSHPTQESAVEAARVAVGDGADVLDVGGESTRPGSRSVSAEEQILRTVPAIEAMRKAGIQSPISIDTTSAAVARACLEAGAEAINDISGGMDDPAMLALAAERGAGLVLMHRLRAPAEDRYSDQYRAAPLYRDVVADVRAFLETRKNAALAAGVAAECICLDPGLGFGKSVEQNLELIRRTGEIAELGSPVLSGLSRKSFVGRWSLGRDSAPSERLEGTLKLSVEHWRAGASVFRVHDVAEHVAALVNSEPGERVTRGR